MQYGQNQSEWVGRDSSKQYCGVLANRECLKTDDAYGFAKSQPLQSIG